MKKLISILLSFILLLSCVNLGTIFAESEEPASKINGAILNLGSTLTLDFFATSDTDVSNTYMRFTSSSGKVTEVNGSYDSAQKMYKYSYLGINPQCMTDTITAELFASDGTLLAKHENYSVALYCQRQINKTAEELGYTSAQHEKFRTLLADMLEYGAQSQLYKDYSTDSLANSYDWVNEYKSDFTVPIGVKEVIGNTDSENKVKSLGVHVSNANNVFFKLVLNDENVEVYVDGTKISRSELIQNTDGSYTYYTHDLKATEFDKVFTLKLVKDGNTISTVSYNVCAYVGAKHNDASVGELSKALYNYGKSAKEYVKATNTNDSVFDLGDDDVLGTPIKTETISTANSTFEGISFITDTDWFDLDDASDNIKLDLKIEDGNQFLVAQINENAANYQTPMLDIMPLIKRAGEYTITFRYKITTRNSDSVNMPFTPLIRTKTETSFSTDHNGNYYLNFPVADESKNNVWHTYRTTIKVLSSDIGVGQYWRFGFHSINVSEIAEIAIDDFSITEAIVNQEQPVSVSDAETWRTNEITLISNKKYDDPYRDVDVNLILTNGTTTYTVPGFWDGGDIWRIRFMCPTEGQWSYTTVCTDSENTGLHNQTNTVTCTKYSGELDLYKHGRVKVVENVKYFMYDDNTPFFYLADTHWGLGGETVEMVETITANRVQNGYSVIQSQPLSAKFNFEDGISIVDISALREYDQKFKIIADAGLTHVNASFFYPSSMMTFINNFGGFSNTVVGTATHPTTQNDDGTYEYLMYDLSDSAKAELERICRYWVARYSAFPVMWSMGQEVDNDFFWQRDNFNGHKEWSYVNNPYHYVAQYISKYDAYNSPLTAHMEGVANTRGVRDSSFRDMKEHDFFAIQWSPSLHDESNNHIYAYNAMEYGQGKPVVNYEGRYCYLWTKNFGARAQGWISYLGGVFGYAWGGQDTWCYLSEYDEDSTTTDKVDTITPEEKQAATWEDSLAYPSAIQMGYMRSFFEDTVGDWWNLIPRFGADVSTSYESNYLTRADGALANIASNADNSKIVIYFFNFSDTSVAENPNSENGTATGTLKNLSRFTTYHYRWFDPINNTYSAEATFNTYLSSSYNLPEKPAGTDYVLYIYK